MLDRFSKLIGGFAETLGNLLLFVALPLFLALFLASARREAAHEAAIDQRSRQVAALAADLDAQFRNLGPMVSAFAPGRGACPVPCRIDVVNRRVGRFHIAYRALEPKDPPRLFDNGEARAWRVVDGPAAAPPSRVFGQLNDFRLERLLDSWAGRDHFDTLAVLEKADDAYRVGGQTGKPLSLTDLRPITAKADRAGGDDELSTLSRDLRALLPVGDGLLPNSRTAMACRFVAEKLVIASPCLAEALVPGGRMLVFVQPFSTLRWGRPDQPPAVTTATAAPAGGKAPVPHAPADASAGRSPARPQEATAAPMRAGGTPESASPNAGGQPSDAIVLAAVDQERLSQEYADGPPLLTFAIVVIVLTVIALATFLRVRSIAITWSYGSAWLVSVLAAFAALAGVGAAVVAAILAYSVEEARLVAASRATAQDLAAGIASDLTKLHLAASATPLYQDCANGRLIKGPSDRRSDAGNADGASHGYPVFRSQTGFRFEGYSVPDACLTLGQLDHDRDAADFTSEAGSGRDGSSFRETSKACNFVVKSRAYFDELLRGAGATVIGDHAYALEQVRSRTQGDVQTVLVRACRPADQMPQRAAAGKPGRPAGIRLFGLISSTDLPALLTAVTLPDITTAVVVAPNAGSVPAGTLIAHSERWRAFDTRFGDGFGEDNQIQARIRQFLVAPDRGGWFTEAGERHWFIGRTVVSRDVRTPWIVVAGYSDDAVQRHAAAVGLAALRWIGLGYGVIALVLWAFGMPGALSWRDWIARLWPAEETAGGPVEQRRFARLFLAVGLVGALVTGASGFPLGWLAAVLASATAGAKATTATVTLLTGAWVGGMLITLAVATWFTLAAIPAWMMWRIRSWPAGRTQLGPTGAYRQLAIGAGVALLLPALVAGVRLGLTSEQQADADRRHVELVAATALRQRELQTALVTYASSPPVETVLTHYPADRPATGLAFAGSERDGVEPNLSVFQFCAAPGTALPWLLAAVAVFGGFILLCADVVGRSMLGLGTRPAPEPEIVNPGAADLTNDLQLPPSQRRFRRVMLIEAYSETLAAWKAAAEAAPTHRVQICDLAGLITDGTQPLGPLPLAPTVPTVLILTGIETLFGSQTLRLAILNQLETLNARPDYADTMIWIAMPLAPLDRIAAANERDKRITPDLDEAAKRAWATVRNTSNEVYRWSALLQQFRSVIVPLRPPVSARALAPELAREYRAVDDPHLPHLDPDQADEAAYLRHFGWQSRPEPHDLPVIIARQFAEYFRRTYLLRTDEERLILRALADGQWVRTDTNAFTALLASGIVVMEPWPRLASDAWQVFLKSAETDEALQEQARRVDKGRWPQIRRVALPGVATLLLLMAFSNDQFAAALVPLLTGAAYLWRGLGPSQAAKTDP